MTRKKKYDNVTRTELGRLNKVREQLWELGRITDTIGGWGAIDDRNKFDKSREDLLEQIYEAERFLKVIIFENENPHLA